MVSTGCFLTLPDPSRSKRETVDEQRAVEEARRTDGQIYGAIAVVLATIIILVNIVFPVASILLSIWIYAQVAVLLFAGFSGFCKNTILPIIAIVTLTIYAVIFPLFNVSAFGFMNLINIPIYDGAYLFAIAGIISSVRQNHYRHKPSKQPQP